MCSEGMHGNDPLNHQRQAPNTLEVSWSIGKLALCSLAILILLNMDGFIDIIEQSASDAKSPPASSAISHTRSIEAGKADFFLLYKPSNVEIQVKPIHGDTDLYVVTNEDLDYFINRFPHIKDLLKANYGASSLVVLRESFSWEKISPPSRSDGAPKQGDEGTVYWSAMPPFSYSSVTLGVEKLHVPSAKELPRPLLICVFGSHTGMETDHFNYTIEIRSEQLHTSSYATVRWAAERGTYSYAQHVRRFSMLSSDLPGGVSAQEKDKEADDDMTNEAENDVSLTADAGPIKKAFQSLSPIVLGVLETIFL